MPRTTPRHRSAPSGHRTEIVRRSLPRLTRRSIAACAIGTLAVSGVAVATQTVDGTTEPAAAEAPTLASSGTTVSRDAVRPPLSDVAASAADDVTEAADALEKKQAAAARKKREAAAAKRRIEEAVADPRSTARAMLADFGWGADQFGCLDTLWSGESGWNYRATNPSSGAYGIPQSLPGSKMATEGDDWQTNPITQIRWGLRYIERSYGSPCSASSAKAGKGWY